jgi:hypothetical protein
MLIAGRMSDISATSLGKTVEAGDKVLPQQATTPIGSVTVADAVALVTAPYPFATSTE